MKTRPDPTSKPYYRCLSCPRFRKDCGGRPTRDMDLPAGEDGSRGAIILWKVFVLCSLNKAFFYYEMNESHGF